MHSILESFRVVWENVVSSMLRQNWCYRYWIIVVPCKLILIWSVHHKSMLLEAKHNPISTSHIGWARLSYFHHVYQRLRGRDCNVHYVISFFDSSEFSYQQMQHQGTLSIQILPVLFDRFWRGAIPIYLLSIKTWLFLFSTKFFSQTNIMSLLTLSSYKLW